MAQSAVGSAPYTSPCMGHSGLRHHLSLHPWVPLIATPLGTIRPCVLGYSLSLHPWVPLITTLLGTIHPCDPGYCSSLHPWVPLTTVSLGTAYPHILYFSSMSSGTTHPCILVYRSSLHPWVPCILIPTSSGSSPHPQVLLIPASLGTTHPAYR